MIGHVLMTGDAAGGVWTYCMELAAALAKEGVRVTLAIMGPPPSPAHREEAAAIPELSLREGLFPLEWMDDPWSGVERAGDWLLALEQETRPDIIHLNGYVHAALPWRAPVMVVAHSCVLSWWRAVKGETAPLRYGRYRSEVQRGLRAAGIVVSPTAAMLAALEQDYGTLPKTAVIPNARTATMFPEVRKEPFVFFAGRIWDEAKNARVLDEVAPQLPWPVYAAGDSHHPDGSVRAPASLRHLGLLDAKQLAAWLARASVYALPAFYEPFGLSALEAALAGCALVLSDIPSLREVWGDAALYAPPHDADAWRRTLVDLIEDSARRQERSHAARSRAMTYGPERMAREYLSVYRVLCSTVL